MALKIGIFCCLVVILRGTDPPTMMTDNPTMNTDIPTFSTDTPTELTEEPTLSPTPAPSLSPTPAPTESPTPSPTLSPTPAPTSAPTPAPSLSPTPSPSLSPTPAPTESPTPAPSLSPTPSPSLSPTPAPSISPTPAPSLSPTPAPTLSPTPGPTLSPTPAPSLSPTPAPSESPTPSPTNAPSLSPTPAPSNSPTPSPSDSPTPGPTNAPSNSPTLSPTPAPTDVPTMQPTLSQNNQGIEGVGLNIKKGLLTLGFGIVFIIGFLIIIVFGIFRAVSVKFYKNMCKLNQGIHAIFSLLTVLLILAIYEICGLGYIFLTDTYLGEQNTTNFDITVLLYIPIALNLLVLHIIIWYCYLLYYPKVKGCFNIVNKMQCCNTRYQGFYYFMGFIILFISVIIIGGAFVMLGDILNIIPDIIEYGYIIAVFGVSGVIICFVLLITSRNRVILTQEERVEYVKEKKGFKLLSWVSLSGLLLFCAFVCGIYIYSKLVHIYIVSIRG